MIPAIPKRATSARFEESTEEMQGLFMGGILGAMLLIGFSSTLDLDDFNEFSSDAWVYYDVFERTRQEVTHLAGVADEAGNGYLALVCTGQGRIELHASVGRYIGVPRNPRPLRIRYSGGVLELSPLVRGDHFWWPEDEAMELIDLLATEDMISAHFELWDRSIHVARYSLAGSKAMIRELRSKCR